MKWDNCISHATKVTLAWWIPHFKLSISPLPIAYLLRTRQSHPKPTQPHIPYPPTLLQLHNPLKEEEEEEEAEEEEEPCIPWKIAFQERKREERGKKKEEGGFSPAPPSPGSELTEQNSMKYRSAWQFDKLQGHFGRKCDCSRIWSLSFDNSLVC